MTHPHVFEICIFKTPSCRTQHNCVLNIYFWLKHNGYVLPGEYEILFVSQQLENILTRRNVKVMTDTCNIAIIGVYVQMIKSSRKCSNKQQ